MDWVCITRGNFYDQRNIMDINQSFKDLQREAEQVSAKIELTREINIEGT